MEEELCLPDDTQRILNEFLNEKAQRERDELDKIQNKTGNECTFTEDWQLSQFWYSIDTIKTLAHVPAHFLQEQKDLKIALLSCPSLYAAIKELNKNVKVFEFDRRFAAFGDDFVYYDFNDANSENYLHEHAASFDLIFADPPFLSEECIAKISKIIKTVQKPDAKIVFCSGAVVEPWLRASLPLQKCLFKPEHQRNLANEFVTYANFNLDELIACK